MFHALTNTLLGPDSPQQEQMGENQGTTRTHNTNAHNNTPTHSNTFTDLDEIGNDQDLFGDDDEMDTDLLRATWDDDDGWMD